MRLLRPLAVLTLLLALLLALLLGVGTVTRPRVPLTHPAAAFRNAACVCPLCVVTDGLLEASWGEYC